MTEHLWGALFLRNGDLGFEFQRALPDRTTQFPHILDSDGRTKSVWKRRHLLSQNSRFFARTDGRTHIQDPPTSEPTSDDVFLGTTGSFTTAYMNRLCYPILILGWRSDALPVSPFWIFDAILESICAVRFGTSTWYWKGGGALLCLIHLSLRTNISRRTMRLP